MVVHACIDFISERGFPITSKVNGALGEVTTTDSLTFFEAVRGVGGGIIEDLASNTWRGVSFGNSPLL